jgi:hypothetical protein
VVVHACNPSTKNVETGGPRVEGEPGLYGETISLRKKGRKEGKKLDAMS